MRELDVKLQRLISRYNAEYGPRGLVFRFRKSWYIASWVRLSLFSLYCCFVVSAPQSS